MFYRQPKRRLICYRYDYPRIAAVCTEKFVPGCNMSLLPGGFYYQVAQEYFGTSSPEKHLVKKYTIFGQKILETFV